MNQKPLQPDQEFSKDLKTFEKLPTKIKELSLLQQQAEKPTGAGGQCDERILQDRRENDSL